MSFDIVRAKKIFCQKYAIFLFRHCILENIENINTRQLLLDAVLELMQSANCNTY